MTHLLEALILDVLSESLLCAVGLMLIGYYASEHGANLLVWVILLMFPHHVYVSVRDIKSRMAMIEEMGRES